MKKLNIVFSVVLIVVAGYFFTYANTFKTMPGQTDIGPAAFPKFVCVALALCAVLLIFQQLREKSDTPVHLFNVKLLIGFATALGYFLLLKPVGFLLTSMAAVFIMMMLLLNEPVKKALPAIIIFTFAVPIVLQLVFGMFLKVPLPEGVLAFLLS